MSRTPRMCPADELFLVILFRVTTWRKSPRHPSGVMVRVVDRQIIIERCWRPHPGSLLVPNGIYMADKPDYSWLESCCITASNMKVPPNETYPLCPVHLFLRLSRSMPHRSKNNRVLHPVRMNRFPENRTNLFSEGFRHEEDVGGGARCIRDKNTYGAETRQNSRRGSCPRAKHHCCLDTFTLWLKRKL